MASRLTEIVIDAADPTVLAEFWRQVLGYEITATEDGDISIGGPPGSGPELLFQRVPEGKSVKNRVHLDVNSTDRDQADEVARLVGLGARPVDIGQGDVSWVVLADPEGNEFCVLRRRVAPAPEPLVAAEA
jgi:Glyoxalase-like domain